jgi:hypothetical protein
MAAGAADQPQNSETKRLLVCRLSSIARGHFSAKLGELGTEIDHRLTH